MIAVVLTVLQMYFFLLQNSTRADLEQARLQLEEAQRREADQLKIIQMLERENRQWKEKQRQIRSGIMSNSQCMANLNEIARHGSSNSPTSTPSLSTLEVCVSFLASDRVCCSVYLATGFCHRLYEDKGGMLLWSSLYVTLNSAGLQEFCTTPTSSYFIYVFMLLTCYAVIHF